MALSFRLQTLSRVRSSPFNTANDYASSLQLYSSSLRTFAQAILSSLPQISINPPQLPPLSSTTFEVNPPLPTPRAQPQPQPKEEADLVSSATVGLSPEASLTIFERRTAMKEMARVPGGAFVAAEVKETKKVAEEEKREQEQRTTVEWFALQPRWVQNEREREKSLSSSATV